MNTTSKIRLRFAPSPTGGLHIGGMRTLLFNYLFARQYGGELVLRIEDTDQSRYVEGAEAYIMDCMAWCGIFPDESPAQGGPYGPYRQSERTAIYRQYVEQLIAGGHAYYAFDTSDELEQSRKEIANFKYDYTVRSQLKNSLSLPEAKVNELLKQGVPYVVRIKVPEDEKLSFTDMIRGELRFNTSEIDDKVLLKADGMPTYHLAVVVDDYLMKITHAFRGEEWLPSMPIHLLLWRYLGWLDAMPQWAHMPLILKPDGHGKLSKRDGDRLGFPVYAIEWNDPKTGSAGKGFREMGFLPQAFINMLALLGWNNGSEQELFGTQELIEEFSINRINKAGAKFDFEKAKWINHQWIKRLPAKTLIKIAYDFLREHGVQRQEKYIEDVLTLVKDRLILFSELWEQTSYFFQRPVQLDLALIKLKWDTSKRQFFEHFIHVCNRLPFWDVVEIENGFKVEAEKMKLKASDLMLPLRIMLVGKKSGPNLFEIAKLIGKGACIERIRYGLEQLS